VTPKGTRKIGLSTISLHKHIVAGKTQPAISIADDHKTGHSRKITGRYRCGLISTV